MTKNNLRQHLSWLLNRGPPQFPALQLSTLSDESTTTSTVRSTTTLTISLDAQPTEYLSRTSAPSDHGPALQKPAEVKVDNDGDIVIHDAEMARLQIAPSSTTKPRMLSCTKNGSPSIPSTPSTHRALDNGGTKLDTLTRSSVKGTVPASDSPKQSTRKTPSHRSVLPLLSSDFKSPFDEVESIDLTGDVEQPTSSGTVETFGEPRRLWREDYASRVEPTPKRGKKRKSNEYQSDLVSPRKDSPRIGVSGTPSKTRVVERSTSPISHRDSTKPSRKLEWPSHASPVRPAVSKISSTRNRKNVIADSDDDDGEEMEDTDLFNWDAEEKLQYPDLSNKLMNVEHDEPSSQPKSQTKELPTKSMSMASEALVQSTPRCSPRKEHKSTQIVPAEASTPSFSQMTKDPKVDRFLSLSSTAVETALDTLLGHLKANAEIVYQHAMEGEPPPAEINARTKSLRSEIDAIEKAKMERAAHQRCKSRIEDLKAKMIKGIVEDSSGLLALTAELEQSRSTAKELQQIEARMADLLDIVNLELLNCAQSNARVASGPSALMQGTQHFQTSRHSDTSSEKIVIDCSPAPTFERSHAPKPTLSSLSHRIDNMAPSCDDSDNSIFAGGDNFTRNMCSPPTFNNDFDEFDLDDAEDNDFLEAATSVGNLHAPVEKEHGLESRPVFAETSGNINRVPPSRKSVAPDSAAMMAHPWSRDVRNVMRDRFHLRGFRPNQLEAINATLSGKDAFVLMPTGGGKSLCYQLPSVVSSGATKGVTIVVSPLLSLMEDQVEHLKKLKIKAHFINGDVSAEHKRWVSSTLRNFSAEQDIELLYVTPEMVNKNLNLREILQILHRNRKFARLVIDEAHCVSQWGHDFRPDYKELGAFRSEFPGVPVMALTATATETVKLDVIHNLGMSACDVFTQSFNRPNLTYDVRPKKGSAVAIVSQIADLITTSYHRQAGIVYCLSRKDCEKVAQQLSTDHGIKAAHYHAGMDPEERSAIQKGWQSGRHDVIVATIAFGMGIDKPDVRFVIHHTIPKSLEGYYQETGRAGRDGKRSGCYLFYTYKDTAQQKRFIEGSEGSWQQKNRQRQMLRNVVQFCENQSDCRRVQILAYFNESFKSEDCNQTCDNCQSEDAFEACDFTRYAQKALELVKVFKDRKEDVTLLQCIDIFAGSPKKMKPGFKNLPQYGAGSDLELEDVERLFYRLLSEEVLYEASKMRAGFTHTYIRLSKGKMAGEILDGQRSVELKIRVDRQGKRIRKGNTTGVAAAMDDHPQSTNVPSPVAATRRRATRQRMQNGQPNGEDDKDEDSDGFERIRVAGNSNRRRKQALGPPITQDNRLEEVDEIHQLVIEDFVSNAKNECEKIMMQKHLRSQPFSNAILREMVIRFCKDSKELLEIPDIDPDKVERYGEQFLKLVRNSKRLYQDMKKNNEVVPDPNHATVINITSSDEDEYGTDDEIFDVVPVSASGNQGVTSRYFDVSASSNRSLTSRSARPSVGTQSTDPDSLRSGAVNRAATPSAVYNASRGRQRSGSRRVSGGGRRKAAGAGTGRRNFNSGSQRPKKANRASAGTSASGTRPSTSSSKRGGGTSKASLPRIEMMPT